MKRMTKGWLALNKSSLVYDRVANGMGIVAEKTENLIHKLFYQWGLLVVIVGFLLGRAMILSELTPFVLPFLAAVFMIKRERAGVASISLLAGALLSYHGEFIFVLCAIIGYILIQKLVTKFFDDPVKLLPYTVFVTSISTRLLLVFIIDGSITNYALMMATVEAGLSFILTMIFMQSVPLVTSKKLQHPLRNEEIICLIILLASVMTGTVGWSFYEMSVEHVLARYLVLIFAFIGGAAIGSTVGVVTGLILSLASVASLYQMSLLAFAGLLGGLLKEGKKVGVALGLLVGTLLIGMYGDGAANITVTLLESLVAILIFMMTPKEMISKLARYIPGTTEYSKEQQQYLRKIRDVTAGKVEQFSTLFQTLSQSFQTGANVDPSLEDEERQFDYFLSQVTEKTCQTCFKKERCWVQNFSKTYDSMQNLMLETEKNGHVKDKVLQAEWKKYCIRPEKVIDTIKQEHSSYMVNQKLRKQVMESQKLVADQLLGVSRVMGDFAKEIQKEKQAFHNQEESILEALRSVGLEVGHVDVYSLEKGAVEIEMSVAFDEGHGQYEKVIAPMLSDLLSETLMVNSEERAVYPNGYSHVTFVSARRFVVETGVSHVAKGGAWISGDSYSTIDLGSGKHAIAISDGMGNGERAHFESNETLQLLQKILQSGIEETVAIKSVNSVLSIRNNDEMFSTLDLAMIDLHDAHAKFLKIGSIPSFIKRGSQVIKIEASNLPMGIIQEFDVEVVSEQLKPGDLLIMMSDGIFEAPKHVENKDAWMKRLINELTTQDPQEVADVILEKVIRSGRGAIEDDMTIVVSEIKSNTPKWASIPIYKQTRTMRKKAQ
ncbi:stage II sporulation protein E [Alkalihalobacillus alcalophilus ATCC 27647 = CGMCC 1.3604]|uniref:Stage II sporulation protein E n=1 Tax=Alkalihalobacillus alcalophilus ATCC 27647 = CGMCC 1.3604 TaxID=1218173 RepID=A0A094WHQ2_ALKAL|nr:stage II sporulation protein E [Alkalihalobacillus alcalophilus ATCC 27647 = CGMCC 1.3604]THG90619.1 stage II sporulation protein E [Alkalihalobacillus alcalophilus ATCC 27647 = CGMCC 1.3604]